jgi:hypothetical protein
VTHRHQCAGFSASFGGIAVFAAPAGSTFVRPNRHNIETSIAPTTKAGVVGSAKPNGSGAEQMPRLAIAANFGRRY